MLINSKSYFQTCLKQCKTNSYHAGEIMDLYSTGNPSIGVKKDLKAAIKLAKYWEKKKDYTGQKQYFLYYRLERYYKELGKSKEAEYYHELFCYESIKKEDNTILYTTNLKDYLAIQIAKSINDNGKIIDKKRFENIKCFLPTYLKVKDSSYISLNTTQTNKLVKVFNNEKDSKHLVHYIAREFKHSNDISLDDFSNSELEKYYNFLKDLKLSKNNDLVTYINSLIQINGYKPPCEAYYTYGKFLTTKNNIVKYDYDKGFTLIKSSYEKGYQKAYIDIVNHYKNKKEIKELISFLNEHIKKYKDDVEAALLLADTYYQYGNLDKKYYGKAVSLYEKYKDQLNDDRLNTLSKMYVDGLGVEVDLNKAKQYSKSTSIAKEIFKKETEIFRKIKVKDAMFKQELEELLSYLDSENIDKLWELFAILRDHYKVYQNDEAAYKLAKMMWKIKECGISANALATCYCFAIGVEKNEELFHKYIKIAMDDNYPNAYNIYSIYLFDKKDDARIEYLKKAMELNCAVAYRNLGNYYQFDETNKDLNKAKELYEKAYNLGCSSAARDLGFIYYNVEGFDQDIDKALELFKYSADKDNNPKSCYLVYEIIKNSNFTKGDKKEAYSYLKRSYLNDCVWSYPEMTYELKIGENIKKDIKEYYKCVLKGVESNNYYCLNELGDIYYFGNDELKIKIDFKEALKYYKKALEASENNYGYYKLAYMHYRGEGCKVDYEKALTYVKMGVDCNDSRCLWLLGEMYKDGKAVKQDNKQALKYYSAAYKENPKYYAFDYAYLHTKGFPGVLEVDDEKAIKYYQEHLKYNKDDHVAYNNIGICYKNLKNYNKALEYHKKALSINPKYSHANNSIAIYYKEIEKDYVKAAKHYQIAIDNGKTDAYYNLAILYYDKKASNYDVEKALLNFQKAKEHGSRGAIGFIADIYIHSKKDYKKAYDLLVDEKKDNHVICAVYGDLFYNGYYVPTDYKEAIKWYLKAAEFGQSSSLDYRLGRCYYFGHGIEENKEKAKQYIYSSKKEEYEAAINFYNEFFKNN